MTWKDMAKKIVWLGHDCFRVDATKVVYFDAYQISGGPKADLILVSHDHFDHCSPEDVAKIQGLRPWLLQRRTQPRSSKAM